MSEAMLLVAALLNIWTGVRMLKMLRGDIKTLRRLQSSLIRAQIEVMCALGGDSDDAE